MPLHGAVLARPLSHRDALLPPEAQDAGPAAVQLQAGGRRQRTAALLRAERGPTASQDDLEVHCQEVAREDRGGLAKE